MVVLNGENKKTDWLIQSVFKSGDGGIRTPGTSRYNGFQDRRIRPLCHVSAAKVSQLFLLGQVHRSNFFREIPMSTIVS